MKQSRVVVISLLLLTVIVAGCALDQDEGGAEAQGQGQEQREVAEQSPTQGKAQGQTQAGPKVNFDVAEQAKISTLTEKGVIQAAVVALDQDLSVAVEVNQLNRIRLNAIRQSLFHNLRQDHPDMTIHVTTDRKVYWELKKLEEELEQQQQKPEEAQKKLQKLNDDMKG